MVDFGKRFVYFQDRYRKPDGRKYKHKDIERATDGYVTGDYITHLKQGRYENPSYERLRAISEVMGFPPELWYQPEADADGVGTTLRDKLKFLMDTQPELGAGEESPEDEISRLAFGGVSAKRLTMALNGEINELQASEYFALSSVFGLDVSFWYREEPALGNLSPESIVSLRDPEAQGVLNKFHRIERAEDRNFIQDLIDRFTRKDSDSDERSGEDERGA